jgi:hypothetical protein
VVRDHPALDIRPTRKQPKSNDKDIFGKSAIDSSGALTMRERLSGAGIYGGTGNARYRSKSTNSQGTSRMGYAKGNARLKSNNDKLRDK